MKMDGMLKVYHEVMENEAECRIELDDKRARLELLRHHIIAAGYGSGAISGKNQGERDRNEALFIAEDVEYARLEQEARDKEMDVAYLAAERKYLEAVLSLAKARYYSEARMPT